MIVLFERITVRNPGLTSCRVSCQSAMQDKCTLRYTLYYIRKVYTTRQAAPGLCPLSTEIPPAGPNGIQTLPLMYSHI